MSDETKFPKAIDQFWVDKTEIEKWFRRCAEDFPTMYSGQVLVGNQLVYATVETPDVVVAWFNKWFSQFVEGR